MSVNWCSSKLLQGALFQSLLLMGIAAAGCNDAAPSGNNPKTGAGGASRQTTNGRGGNSASETDEGGGESSNPSGGKSQGSLGQGGGKNSSSDTSQGNSGNPPAGNGGTTSGQGSSPASGGIDVGQGGAKSSAIGQGGSPRSTGGSTGKSTVAPSASGFLHVKGSQLLDDSDKPARLTGVNWFGFETSNLSPHGLWARDYRSMLKQIHELGFNTVRVPWCNAMLRDGAKAASVNTYGADPYDGTDPMNGPLEGKTPLQMMDLLVEAAGELNLKLILDNHSRKPDGYMEEKVWYSEFTSEEQWIADWVFMAEHYRGNRTVVGFDLDNEPHGNATWAAGAKDTDWNAAAERCGNAILAVNSDVLIIVEGVEKVGTDGYWWGGNLSGARDKPIVLSKPDKLVYSAHEYGPEVFEQTWFTASNFPSNLSTVWNDHFGFLMKENLGHVLIGEFGIKDPTAAGGKANTWFETFLDYMGPSYSWTFWCWNPNSGDTEGILNYDWLTPKDWKLEALKPYLAPQFK